MCAGVIMNNTPNIYQCACGLVFNGSPLVADLLRAWLEDHPMHTRKRHIYAADVFRWMDRRKNGGIV